MPKIDFYILPDSTPEARFLFTCRLIAKAYKNRHRIFINTENETDAHALDELIWTYRDDSFLPHNLYGEGPEPPPPIQIGFNVTPEKHRDILINLASHLPTFYQQFARVLEIIPAIETEQTAARERFREYRQAGHNIQTHKLETTQLENE